ncbi:hypothetical protein GGX14DRAFT_579462 [Mycena pura]|uniref:Uncharacterized protein n=1 Tax=Mycena pura TaxID=153505 RepID=A0AAD6UMN7_9AGAR|nr:hypothetical protein GGX14DRAFT_579462 [Mycena pura]
MSRLPHGHVHANGDPIFNGPGRFGPVVITNPDPRFPPGWQGLLSSAPAPSAQHPPTRPVASARQMPRPSAIRSDYPSRRQVAAVFSLRAAVHALPASAFPSHKPAPFAARMSETARTGHRWPALSPSSTVVRSPSPDIPPSLSMPFSLSLQSADQVAPPCADATDAWHVTSGMMYYPRAHSYNTEVPITVTFAPSHGPGLVGVAMTELVRGRGLLEPHTPMGTFFPPGYQVGATGRLVFEWPGYDMQLFPLRLQDGQGLYAPRVALGMQIAAIFDIFIEKFGDPQEFTPGTGVMPIPLGRHGVRYERLRLLEAISFDGQDFYVRIATVPPRITTA